MFRRRATRFYARRTSCGAASRRDWRRVRALTALAGLWLWWLARLPAGKSRDCFARFAARHIAMFEQMLRCLLILMKCAPAAPKAAPFAHAPGTGTARPRAARLRRRFSLTLARFTWIRPQAAPGHTVTAIPPAPALPADPVAALEARLMAMQAVFADPAPHAARISRALLSRGHPGRRTMKYHPYSNYWSILDHPLCVLSAPQAPAAADTS